MLIALRPERSVSAYSTTTANLLYERKDSNLHAPCGTHACASASFATLVQPWCSKGDSNPYAFAPAPQAGVSANSTIRAKLNLENEGRIELPLNGFADRRITTLLLVHGARRGTRTPSGPILNRMRLPVSPHAHNKKPLVLRGSANSGKNRLSLIRTPPCSANS